MKRLWIIAFAVFTIKAGLAQTIADSVIISKQLGERWLDVLTTLDKQQQRHMISKRLLADTAVFKDYSRSDRIILRNEKLNDSLTELESAPLFIVGGIPLNGYDRKDRIKMSKLAQLLYHKEIDVTVLDNTLSKQFIGTSKALVIISTKNKKLNRQLSQLRLGN